MNILIILFVALLVVVFFMVEQLLKTKRAQGNTQLLNIKRFSSDTKQTVNNYPYQVSKRLLTNAERSFYGVLSQVVGDEGLIFSKVRIADVIKPQNGLSRSEWQRAFNSISSKHFDFVVCNPNDISVKFVVELDDSTHNKQSQKERDHFVNNACKASSLPLLRIKASKWYVLETLKNEISQLFELPDQRDKVSEKCANDV